MVVVLHEFARVPTDSGLPINLLDERRRRDIEQFQEDGLIMGEFGSPENMPIFGNKFPEMNALHNGPDVIPRAPRVPFRNPHQEQRQKADEDMGADTVIRVVVERPELQQVQKVRSGKEDFFLQSFLMLHQEIHGPVQMLQGDGLRIPQGHILPHPFLHLTPGVRRKSPVGHHGKNGPLKRR